MFQKNLIIYGSVNILSQITSNIHQELQGELFNMQAAICKCGSKQIQLLSYFNQALEQFTPNIAASQPHDDFKNLFSTCM